MLSHAHCDLPFLKNIEECLHIILTFFGEYFSLLLSVSHFQSMCGCHQEKISEKHKVLFSELHSKFRQITELQATFIQSARAKKEIMSTIDDQQLALYIGSLVRGVIFQWQLNGKMGDVSKEIPQLISFIASGLGFSVAADNNIVTETKS
jgi:hypothetical protein